MRQTPRHLALLTAAGLHRETVREIAAVRYLRAAKVTSATEALGGSLASQTRGSPNDAGSFSISARLLFQVCHRGLCMAATLGAFLTSSAVIRQ